MSQSTDPSPPQPVTFNYLTPPRPIKPTRASYVAMILGLVAVGFFLMLAGSVWGGVRVGSRPLLFYLWIACASAAFMFGLRGIADGANWGGVGRGMSWVGVAVGGLSFLVLLAAPLGGINVSLLAVIILLALAVVKK